MKNAFLVLSFSLAFGTAGCSRTASEGDIGMQVLDFTEQQPLALRQSADQPAQSPRYSAASTDESSTGVAVTAEDGSGILAMVCLVSSDTPAAVLGRINPEWECASSDVDGLALFNRIEGEQIALADINGDGVVDSVTFGISPGSSESIEVTSSNPRSDGGWIVTKNDRVIYRHGDTIVAHVRGWFPSAETMHVEMWNNWNGGFHFWSSEPRSVSGAIDFKVQHVIPATWPATNDKTGAAYFSYPVGENIYNGDNFVLLGDRKPDEEGQGDAPINPSIVLADGAEAVSTVTVPALLAAEGAGFYRLSNDSSALSSVPWTALSDDSGTSVPWTLAAGADGLRTVYAQFASAYGITGAVVSDGILLDATPIQVTNLQVTPGLGRSGTSFSIGFTLSEPADGGLSVVFDGRAVSGVGCTGLQCSATYISDGSELEGDVTIGVRAVDAVGWTGTATVTARLDLTPPDTLFDGSQPTGLLAANTVSFGLSSDESPVTYNCSLDGVQLTSCSGAVVLNGLSEGLHTFEASAEDAAGNIDPSPATTTWTVDTMGPETVVDTTPLTVTQSTAASFTFSSPDADAVGFECSLDGGAYAACSSGVAFSVSFAGSHTFNVRAVDAATNVDTTPASYTWSVDQLAPDTVIAVAPSGTVMERDAAVVFYSPDGDVSGFECSLDGAAYVACTSTHALTLLADGVHTFQVRAFDSAGNVDATPATAQWTVDGTAPDTAIDAAPDAAVTSGSATIAFSSPTPDTDHFECSLDNGAYSTCTSSYITSGLSEATHSFLVRAVDGVGNVDPTPASTTWRVDTTPPDTLIDSAPPSFTSATTASIEFSSPAGDVGEFQCSIDGGTFQACISSQALSALSAGMHSFAVRAVDTAGNIDPTPAVTQWTVDDQPPETTILSAPGVSSPVTTATFAFTSNEAASFECRLNSGSWSVCVSSTVYQNLNAGYHLFEVRAKDSAGHVDATPAVHGWTIDLTPPDTAITNAPLAVTRFSSAIFEFLSDEPATFECRINGGGWSTCFVPSQFAGLPEGGHDFSVRAVNVSGLVDPTPATHSWVIDTTPPVVTNLTLSENLLTAGETVTIDFDVSESLGALDVTVGGALATQTGQAGLHYTYTYLITGAETEGAVEIRAVVKDPAGNSGFGSTVLNLDFTAPDTVTGPTMPARFSNDLNPIFEFVADEPATFECALNTSVYTTCVSPHLAGPLTEGDYTLLVRAIDQVGLVDATPGTFSWTVDVTPPADPDGGKLEIDVKPPGTSDRLRGTAGAVEAGATVDIYADSTLFYHLATTVAEADGSFSFTDIGDDVGDSLEQVFVTATDATGNTSGPTPVRNPRIAPRVTPRLVEVEITADTNGNSGVGNPGDFLLVTWDNSSAGDNNAIVTSVSASVPGLGLSPTLMSDTGGGIFAAIFPLVAGPYDADFKAELTVVGEAGLTTGPVASYNSVVVDVEIPGAPLAVSGTASGSLLHVGWSDSPATDVTLYRAYRGETLAPSQLMGEVAFGGPYWISSTAPSCSDQYFGVTAVDDAGNVSALAAAGPDSVAVPVPQIAVWGAIDGLKVKLLSSDPVDQVELHFQTVTEASGAPPWAGETLTGTPSPIVATSGITPISSLHAGTDYLLSSRAINDTCYSEFSTPVTTRTLGVVGHQGGVAICPGCQIIGTIPGKWYYGALGFAVAGVGDAWGNDGKEDILTAVPGQSLSVLVSADPMTEAAVMHGYHASLDIVGGGPSLSSAGDVNNDGKEDFLVGSPLGSTTSSQLFGKVRVFDGATRTLLYEVAGENEGQQLGYAVSRLGDLDADGKDEVLAGGIGCKFFDCNGGFATAGKVYIINSDGTIRRSHSGPQVGGFFGVSVHGGPDVTGDGIADYVVGAPGHVGNDAPSGEVFVYSGANGAEVLRLNGSSTEKFGFSVRLVNGDGPAGTRSLVVVGAPSKVGIAGNVYVYDMTGALVSVLPGWLPEASENFGTAVLSAGDLDGNGTYEIVVGDPNIPMSAQYGTGRAYMYSVADGSLLYEISGNTFDGAMGYALDYVSDHNGDGIDELIVGAPGSAVNGIYNAGRLYVISVKAD